MSTCITTLHRSPGTCASIGTAGHLVLEFHGEIDVVAASEITPFLDSATGRPAPRVVIDLRPVEFFDCSGLRLLFRARRRVLAQGGTLHLVCTEPLTLRILRITGLTQVLPPSASVRRPSAGRRPRFRGNGLSLRERVRGRGRGARTHPHTHRHEGDGPVGRPVAFVRAVPGRRQTERRPMRRRSSRPMITRTPPIAAGHSCAPVSASPPRDRLRLRSAAGGRMYPRRRPVPRPPRWRHP